MDEKMVVVGKRIKVLRMSRSLAQTELAEKIGLSQTNMSNIEHGRTAVTLQNLFKIREVLNCNMKDFFVDFDGVEKDKQEITMDDLQDAVKILQMLREAK